jgi:hypothetical protein
MQTFGRPLNDSKLTRDGRRRYLYDIWRPLTLLMLFTSFTSVWTVWYTFYDPATSTSESQRLFFCNADGSIERQNYGYKPFWDPQLYFTINMSFGKFPFSVVKIIDATWDTVVGRGGQFVAAVLAYQTLRRSLTVTMETCTVTLPAVTSIYCRQIQLGSVGQLLHTMFWHWGSVHSTWRQPIHAGRMRLGLQLFVCIYVLLFATLVSIMTGYRAQLTAFFRYDATGVGQFFPISELEQPRMVVFDGSRVGLSNTLMYARNAITYPGILENGSSGMPGGLGDWSPENPKPSDTSSWVWFNTSEFIASFRDFSQPIGALLDCKQYVYYLF